MTMHNGMGQLMKSENWASFQQGEISIALDNFPMGIYFLNLYADGATLTRQFVIQK